MDKLIELTQCIACDFHLQFNPHKSVYETAEEWSRDHYDLVGDVDYSKDIWVIQVYPRTPVGFISAISNDLDSLLDWAIEGAKDY